MDALATGGLGNQEQGKTGHWAREVSVGREEREGMAKSPCSLRFAWGGGWRELGGGLNRSKKRY